MSLNVTSLRTNFLMALEEYTVCVLRLPAWWLCLWVCECPVSYLYFPLDSNPQGEGSCLRGPRAPAALGTDTCARDL